MDKLLNLEIVTPQKPVFKGNANSVSVPGGLSPFEILYGHAPIVSTLEPGVVKIRFKDDEQIFAIGKGFITVQDNKVSIFVEKAFSKEEINPEDLELKLSELKNKLKEARTEKGKFEINQQIAEAKAQFSIIGK